MSIFTAAFWKDAAERAIKSAAQGFAVGGGLLGLGGEAVANVNVVGFPWIAAASSAGGMALASIVTSLLSAPRAGTMSPASAAKPPTPELDTPGRHARPDASDVE